MLNFFSSKAGSVIQGVASKFKFEEGKEESEGSPATAQTSSKTSLHDGFSAASPGNGSRMHSGFIARTQMEEISKLELEIAALKRRINQVGEEGKKKEERHALEKEQIKEELEKAKEVTLPI
eukprot:TRINITY_DN10359_c0_g2_i1.p1 TRINITY_DN10359_c0_g2~~TRINITY_DN10359_c0_g2_i1.p1  ORF type:complete len:122 (+),score=39.83 TRINITY_DN10359_c0_g2_i1:142-507(+)